MSKEAREERQEVRSSAPPANGGAHDANPGGDGASKPAGSKSARPTMSGSALRDKTEQARSTIAANSSGDLGEIEPKRRYALHPSQTTGPNMPTWLRVPILGPLRRVRRARWWPYLALLGPGVVAASAGDDAGGIATYAQAGASYGYTLLWAMLVVTISLVLVQEMCARMGAVTGKGLSDLIREQFGVGWSLLAVGVLFVANAGVTVSEFVGVAAAAGLVGIPGWVAVPPVAFLIWWSITKGSYKVVEKVFLLLSLVLFSYVIAAFLAKPPWGEVGAAFFKPTISFAPADLAVLVALIGTTITPYMQLFVQSGVVEKGVTPRDYKYTRFDTVFGAIFSDVVAAFIIIATAATLFAQHIPINSAADAAKALEPVAGTSATVLFALGLFGASVLAAGVLPLATAYSVTESLGFEKGVSLSFSEAPVFMGLFTALVAGGALIAIIPGLPLFAVLLAVQVLNGSLLPILLVFIVKLASNKDIMGRYAIGPLYRVLAWASVVVIAVAVALMLVTLVIH
ncbi:MAG: Nramp family divalent metal transporter [Chloroflexota bacterium]|nr:Nramp family divalent metal transporter [Chloroflexota bacterium]